MLYQHQIDAINAVESRDFKSGIINYETGTEIKKKIWEEIESTQGLYSSYLSLDMTAVTESIENSKTTEVDSEEVVIEVVN